MQDLRAQRGHPLGGAHAEFLGERAAQPVVNGERGAALARVVQRLHEQGMGALPQRAGAGQRSQAADRRLGALEGGHRDKTVLLDLQVQFLQPRRLAQGELRSNPGKRRPGPQRQRPGQGVVRPRRRILPQETSSFVRQALESERVDAPRIDRESVAAAVGNGADAQVVLREPCAGSRGEPAERGDAPVGELRLPDVVEKRFRRHAGSRCERQSRDQCDRAGARQRDRRPVRIEHLNRTEEPHERDVVRVRLLRIATLPDHGSRPGCCGAVVPGPSIAASGIGAGLVGERRTRSCSLLLRRCAAAAAQESQYR